MFYSPSYFKTVCRRVSKLAAAGIGLSALALTASAEPPTVVVKSIDDIKLLQGKVLDVVKKAQPATVSLTSDFTGAWGSGVVVSENGLILSAAHVVQGAKSMVVIFPDGTETKATVLGMNKTKDTAMLQIIEKGTYPFVRMGSSDSMKVGDYLVAMGHAGGHDPLRKPPVRFGRMVSRNLSGYFSSDCTLIGGDSGGPVFNIDAELVGINSSIGIDSKANNHAGISGLKDDWERLLAGESWGSLGKNPFADGESPVLGIILGGNTRFGVRVGNVSRQSMAHKAGVQRGDIIFSVNGTRVPTASELLVEVNRFRPGQKVTLGLLRGNQKLETEVTLMSRGQLYKN